MKIQYLTVIFIIILMPIVIVFSSYINNQITTVKTENIYDARLLDSTYDAIKAYKLNTVNNATSDKPFSKVEDLEAAATTFLNSAASNFGFTGYRSTVMQEYIPAVVFTLYDGYYIYSPFTNTLTGVTTEVDDEYKDSKVLHGLKPYVYYNCRYKMNNGNDFVITYTLDNYITIDGQINGSYVHDYGYLVSGISKNGETYTYDGIQFTKDDTEAMSEYLGEELYYYVKYDGQKFYYHGNATNGNINNVDNENDYIFYIDYTGAEHKQIIRRKNNENNFDRYYNAIFHNTYGYEYYKQAYEFTNKVINTYGLSALTKDDVEDSNIKNNLITTGRIFDGNIQDSDSNFNGHRSEVIRNVIETNLSTSISSYKKYSNTKEDVDFIMPKISETDWELIENNICLATFLQGLSIGGKVYNGYAVVPNNVNKEYIDENDIYILTSDKYYSKPTDKELLGTKTIEGGLRYYPGVWKNNFERRKDSRSGDQNASKYYYPLSYKNGDSIIPYYGSYTSIIGSTTNDNQNIDLYKYMRSINNNTLKKAYYMALGRERMGSYSVDRDML